MEYMNPDLTVCNNTASNLEDLQFWRLHEKYAVNQTSSASFSILNDTMPHKKVWDLKGREL